MDKMTIKQKNTMLIIAIASIATISLTAIGFAAWSGGSSPDSKETSISVAVDQVQFAGFSNIVSKNTIKFDAPVDDNIGKIVYTNDIGGEQLKIDVTGTVLNYSQVGSIEITTSIDSSHESAFSYVKSHKYINEPVFETLTRKATVSNPTADGSYWISNHDTANDTRDFEIIASFSWGDFFAGQNPSVFFDSMNVNIDGKAGTEYDETTIKSILATIHELNHSIYTLHLSVTAFSYSVNFLSSDNPFISTLPASINDIEPTGSFTVPSSSLSATGYTFQGYSFTKNNTAAEYQPGQTYPISQLVALDNTVNAFNLYTVFIAKSLTITINSGSNASSANQTIATYTDKKYGDSFTLPSAPAAASNYKFTKWKTDSSHGSKEFDENATITLIDSVITSISSNNSVTITAQWESTGGGGGVCVLPETLITLWDGTVKQSKYITKDDLIATYNHVTGEYEPQHIIFNVDFKETLFDIVKLTFSNGKTMELASGHGFFNLTHNSYEIYYAGEFEQHIGELFATTDYINGKFVTIPAELIKVENSKRMTRKYSPLTEYNINAITDGILTIADDIEGMLDSFTYLDGMKIDMVSLQNDINTYGVYEYEDVKNVVPEYIFNVFNFKYWKIFIAKGTLSYDKVNYWITRYVPDILEQNNIDWDFENREPLSEKHG